MSIISLEGWTMCFKRMVIVISMSIFLFLSACTTSSEVHYQNLVARGISIVSSNQQIIFILPSEKLFVCGTDQLTSNGMSLLDQVVGYLGKIQYSNIHVSGHTDPIFDHMKYHNQNLSLLQAKQVSGYLWDHGINDESSKRQLTYSGENADQPIVSNSTLAGMRKNGRIQITIYSGKLDDSGIVSPFKTQYQW